MKALLIVLCGWLLIAVVLPLVQAWIYEICFKRRRKKAPKDERWTYEV